MSDPSSLRPLQVPSLRPLQDLSLRPLQAPSLRPLQASSLRPLQELQCHYTWGLDSVRFALLRDLLLDIDPDEGRPWRGQIWNFLGFLQDQLGRPSEAQRLFSSASSLLTGPALIIHYSDRAWFHHRRGEREQTEKCLRRVQEQRREEEQSVHPEVLAEKAWTLMNFGCEQKQEAVDLFERALREFPDREEWRSTQAIALLSLHKDRGEEEPEVLQRVQEVLRRVQRVQEELREENLYLSARILLRRQHRGEQVSAEAAELMSQVIEGPCGLYSGLRVLLRVFREEDLDEAQRWADEALRRKPESRYVKNCAANTYRWSVLQGTDGAPRRPLVVTAVRLLREVIRLYPDTAAEYQIKLAQVYAKSGETSEAEEIYKDLLLRNLPIYAQSLFHNYAKFLFFQRHDPEMSLQFHLRAARIPEETRNRTGSIRVLQRRRARSERLRWEIRDFLSTLYPDLQ